MEENLQRSKGYMQGLTSCCHLVSIGLQTDQNAV